MNKKQLPCTIPGCDKLQDGRGMCHQHYYRATEYGSPYALTKREQRWTGMTQDEARRLVVTMTAEGQSCAAIARATGYSEAYIPQLRWEARQGRLGADLELATLIAEQQKDLRKGDKVGGSHWRLDRDRSPSSDGSWTGYDSTAVDASGQLIDKADRL